MRYLNNGITETLITILQSPDFYEQNFKTSQFDKLFDAHSVKVTHYR